MINQFICNSYKKEIIEGLHSKDHEYYITLHTDLSFMSKYTTCYLETLYEVEGDKGYSRGGKLLQGFKARLDDDIAILDFEVDPVWNNSSITACGAFIYNNSLENKNAVCILDFGGTYSSKNGDFKIKIPDANQYTGLIRIV